MIYRSIVYMVSYHTTHQTIVQEKKTEKIRSSDGQVEPIRCFFGAALVGTPAVLSFAPSLLPTPSARRALPGEVPRLDSAKQRRKIYFYQTTKTSVSQHTHDNNTDLNPPSLLCCTAVHTFTTVHKNVTYCCIYINTSTNRKK